MIIISFIVCLIIFAVIGLSSVAKKKDSPKDYLLASRSLTPWLTGLSAVATTNSGFMFTAWIGMTYVLGVSSIWFLIGLGSGSTVGLLTTAKHVRKVSAERNIYSFGGLISGWQGEEMKTLRYMLGWGIIIFLSTYAAAQLTASSKAMHVLFGWDLNFGSIIGAVVIVLYCFAGGIRASVWTDVAQSIVMIGAMILLLFTALGEIGGIASLWAQLEAMDPKLVHWLPSLQYSPWLYIFGWFVGGVGISAQPHIMVRFMAADKTSNVNKSLVWYFSWYYLFFLSAWGVGLAAKVLIPEVDNFDAELALPTIASDLLPQVLVGVILAGLFAAAISTADSLVLSASASLSRDIMKKPSESMLVTKGSTLLITALVLMISLWGNKSVLMLVALAWSALATVITPLLYLYIFKQKVTQPIAIAMTVLGTITAFEWYLSGRDGLIWPSFPGIAVVLVVYLSYRLYDKLVNNRS